MQAHGRRGRRAGGQRVGGGRRGAGRCGRRVAAGVSHIGRRTGIDPGARLLQQPDTGVAIELNLHAHHAGQNGQQRRGGVLQGRLQDGAAIGGRAGTALERAVLHRPAHHLQLARIRRQADARTDIGAHIAAQRLRGTAHDEQPAAEHAHRRQSGPLRHRMAQIVAQLLHAVGQTRTGGERAVGVVAAARHRVQPAPAQHRHHRENGDRDQQLDQGETPLCRNRRPVHLQIPDDGDHLPRAPAAGIEHVDLHATEVGVGRGHHVHRHGERHIRLRAGAGALSHRQKCLAQALIDQKILRALLGQNGHAIALRVVGHAACGAHGRQQRNGHHRQSHQHFEQGESAGACPQACR